MRIDITPDYWDGSKMVYSFVGLYAPLALEPAEVERRLIANKGPGKLIDDGERVWFELADRNTNEVKQ